jgi:hypothetical protein
MTSARTQTYDTPAVSQLSISWGKAVQPSNRPARATPAAPVTIINDTRDPFFMRQPPPMKALSPPHAIN